MEKADNMREQMSPDGSKTELPIRPRGIAFDLDGTLLDYDGRLDPSVAKAVRLISRGGIKVFLVTGRHVSSCERFWRELELATPLAACNGAWVGFPGQEPIQSIRLSRQAVDIVTDLGEKHNLYVNYYLDEGIYTLKDGPEREWYSHHYSAVELLPDSDSPILRRLPSKCLCLVPESEWSRFIDIFIKALGNAAVVTTSSERHIEIIPSQANKAVGLRAAAGWAGIPAESCIAVGDAMNDLPMLAAAGFSITLASGDPALVEHVDMVLPPLWEDGMEILAKCVLGMSDSGRFLTTRSRRFIRK